MHAAINKFGVRRQWRRFGFAPVLAQLASRAESRYACDRTPNEFSAACSGGRLVVSTSQLVMNPSGVGLNTSRLVVNNSRLVVKTSQPVSKPGRLVLNTSHLPMSTTRLVLNTSR